MDSNLVHDQIILSKDVEAHPCMHAGRGPGGGDFWVHRKPYLSHPLYIFLGRQVAPQNTAAIWYEIRKCMVTIIVIPCQYTCSLTKSRRKSRVFHTAGRRSRTRAKLQGGDLISENIHITEIKMKKDDNEESSESSGEDDSRDDD